MEKKYIAGYNELEDSGQGVLRIALKYTEGVSAISGLQRVSKPGLRVYAGSDNLPRVMNGLGVAMISTSSGVMTEREAAAKGIGGEVLCYVW